MTYNADGSEYFLIAANLKKITDERYSKAIKDEGKLVIIITIDKIYIDT